MDRDSLRRALGMCGTRARRFFRTGGAAQSTAAASLLTKDGRHIRMVTDVPDSPQLSEYVAAFDAAVPHWAAYWQVDAEKLKDWRVTAFLMNDKQAFIDRGLIPRRCRIFPMAIRPASGFGSSIKRAITTRVTCCCMKARMLSAGGCLVAVGRHGTWKGPPSSLAPTAGQSTDAPAPAC